MSVLVSQPKKMFWALYMFVLILWYVIKLTQISLLLVEYETRFLHFQFNSIDFLLLAAFFVLGWRNFSKETSGKLLLSLRAIVFCFLIYAPIALVSSIMYKFFAGLG
jgi:hypothetical protein